MSISFTDESFTEKNDILKLTTEKQIYSNACDEYAEITSLLFN